MILSQMPGHEIHQSSQDQQNLDKLCQEPTQDWYFAIEN
jgi:hypothetical protein